LRETLDFLDKTQTFAASPSTSDIASRTSDVDARLAQIDDFTAQLSGILNDEEKFYDIRYLWIDQRTNRKEGTFVKKLQAVDQRQEDIQKIINDQQKLLVVSKITV
jgi:Tfp pilus assembly protein PilN